MNFNRWVLASIAVAVAVAISEMLIHGVVLQATYQQTATVWRLESDMQPIAPLMWLGYAIFAPFFVWIYAKGWEAGKPALEQGVRFGLMFGIGLSAMNALIWYVVLPIPAGLAWSWFFAGIAMYLVAGIVVALVYQPAAEPPQPAPKTTRKARRRR
jgi:hypothetical protein